MDMTPVEQWRYSQLFALWSMWAVMMAGMMLPSAFPVIALVNQLNHKRLQRGSPYTHTLYFIVGYLLAWTLYSLLITLIQWYLHTAYILSPMMVSHHSGFTAFLLIVAGGYQWTPLKQQCLQLCHSPMTLFSKYWREGVGGAVYMGFKHGQYCVGCCWFLMALLFVTGVMDLFWIFVLTLWVMFEKLFAFGPAASKLFGLVLIISGITALFVKLPF